MPPIIRAMRFIVWLAVLTLAVLIAACGGGSAASTSAPPATLPVIDLSSFEPDWLDPSAPHPTPVPEPSDPPTAQPTEAAPASPQATFAQAPPSADCVNGWTRPVPGSDEHEHALDVLSAQMGVDGPWNVADMRYFTGPELPFTEPQFDSVERWYVKAALVDDPTFQARWLIERRTDQIQGISAVARFDSTGYMSPDWTGFVGEGEPVAYIGLPGTWSGVPYDFVSGEGDSGNPGLPPEVVGCMTGT